MKIRLKGLVLNMFYEWGVVRMEGFGRWGGRLAREQETN